MRSAVRAHKKLTDWAGRCSCQVRRWLPGRSWWWWRMPVLRPLICLWRMTQLANPICMITRFRLDAALYEPAPARQAGQKVGRARRAHACPPWSRCWKKAKTRWKLVIIPTGMAKVGARWRSFRILRFGTTMACRRLPIRWVLIRDPKGQFKPQALLCTDLTVKPEQILKWFVMRWQVEVTFHEVTDHLGVETQRQWSRPGYCSHHTRLVGLVFAGYLAGSLRMPGADKLPGRQAAWYTKPLPTFSDALALVRQELWQHLYFQPSHFRGECPKISR